MSQTKIDKGYTVIYDTEDGKIGFIGIDVTVCEHITAMTRYVLIQRVSLRWRRCLQKSTKTRIRFS